MSSTKYDPPSGGQPPQYQQYPQYPQPYYQPYPYSQPYPPPKPGSDASKIAIIIIIVIVVIVAITVVLAGVLYVWVTSLSSPSSTDVETIVASLEQGDGNMSCGCLFTLTKRSGEPVRIDDYSIKVCEIGRSPITLRWSTDGNSSYSLDRNSKPNDDDWWDAAEVMGFDAPAALTGIDDGDRIEVSMINLAAGAVAYSSSFIYDE